jgi:hypothetical protein
MRRTLYLPPRPAFNREEVKWLCIAALLGAGIALLAVCAYSLWLGSLTDGWGL